MGEIEDGMLVDQKCVELAEHFLADVWVSRPEDVRELAEIIQSRIEGFIEDVLAGAMLKRQTGSLVIVPREPSEAMLVDGAAACRDFLSQNGPYPRAKAVWSAMIAAARKAPPHE